MKTWLPFLCLLLFPVWCFADNVYTLNEQWVGCGNGVQLLDPYFSPGVTFTWDGPSKNGKAHGKGKATKYVNGEFESSYVGEYKDGVREGKGTFTHKDGSVRKGTFVAGQLTGKGTMETENGSFYEGEFVNYRMHGNGKLKSGNGSEFEGFLVSDYPYTGKITHYDGSVMYVQAGYPVDNIVESKSKYNPKKGKKLTEYFDEDWKRTDDPKKAKYYRIITYDAPHVPKGTVRDYYMNGKLQGEADFVYIDYDDEGKNFQEGVMTLYYPNGMKELEASYLNNSLNGTKLTYYDNGNVESEMFYVMDVPEGAWITYYENGKPKSAGYFEHGALKNNSIFSFDEDGVCFLMYHEDFEANKKNWESRSPNGELSVTENNTITFDVTPGRQLSGGLYVDFSPETNNIVNISTLRNPGDKGVMIALLFGFKDWNNYCGLFISGYKFAYQQIQDGKVADGTEWTFNDAIAPDMNTLTVSNMGDALVLGINNQIVTELPRPSYAGGMCVLCVQNDGYENAEVLAGDLDICELIDYTGNGGQGDPIHSSDLGDWKATGSGFFLTENGLLATNYHVVKGMDSIEITFHRNDEEETYPATMVLSDPDNDLAILAIDSPAFTAMPAIPYNFTTQIKDTGSEVFTLGYPLSDVMGDEVKFTDGKISAKTGIQNDPTVYQISVPIQPGNSGGPLFDTDGNLVGITSAGLNRDYFKSENVNYAVKSLYLKSLVDELPDHVELQQNADISTLPLTEKIKVLQPYTIFIKVK